jgi:Protein of unknown function (DUF3570)
LQLTRAAAAVALAALLLAGGASVARAQERTYRIDVSGAYFVEPAARETLHVFHPQVTALLDLAKWFSLSMGYDADVVSGATPRTYGTPMDAITSATKFSDVRHAFHGGVEVRIGPTAVDASYTYAFENDYRSHELDVSARVDLWGKNTTFRLDYSHNFDSVCDADNRGAMPLERRPLTTSTGCFNPKTPGILSESLAIDSYAASWTQVLTPILLSEVSVGYQVLDGFQSNPYRRVRLFSGTVEAQESEPLLRQRIAIQARLRVALRKLHAAIGASGRVYWDTWGIKSGTAELAWEQYVIPQVLVRLRGRFYQQGRALFYRDAGEALSYDAVGPVGQYFTGDRELSPFRDYLVGLKLSYLRTADERGKIWRAFEALDLNAKADLISYQALTPHPPNEARSNSLFGAMLFQLSLSLRW